MLGLFTIACSSCKKAKVLSLATQLFATVVHLSRSNRKIKVCQYEDHLQIVCLFWIHLANSLSWCKDALPEGLLKSTPPSLVFFLSTSHQESLCHQGNCQNCLKTFVVRHLIWTIWPFLHRNAQKQLCQIRDVKFIDSSQNGLNLELTSAEWIPSNAGRQV